MKPGTIIEYLSEESYRVVVEGKGNVSKKRNTEDPYVGQATVNGSILSAKNEILPMPSKGMRVIYGSDGYIVKISNYGTELDMFNYTTNENTLGLGKSEESDMEQMGGFLVATWGANNNRLYKPRSGTARIGRGRATTFSDSIGQNNIALKKGDVATKLQWDNCPVGTIIEVSATANTGSRKTIRMVKNDAGGMPDAIVDIWKNGVEYWGYSWSSWFSMPGEVEIYHN